MMIHISSSICHFKDYEDTNWTVTEREAFHAIIYGNTGMYIYGAVELLKGVMKNKPCKCIFPKNKPILNP